MKDYKEHVRRVVGEDDHERIWLQNAIDAGHTEEGRLWCPDKVWPDDPEDGEPTEYVRADLYAAAQAEIEKLRIECELARLLLDAPRAAVFEYLMRKGSRNDQPK